MSIAEKESKQSKQWTAASSSPSEAPTRPDSEAPDANTVEGREQGTLMFARDIPLKAHEWHTAY